MILLNKLIYLVKVMTKGGQKSQKNYDVFYERPLNVIVMIERGFRISYFLLQYEKKGIKSVSIMRK